MPTAPARIAKAADRTLPQSAVERVAETLRGAIYNGRYAPGQRLFEADLTNDYSVSRSTVRTALAQLEAEGLVESIPGRGSAVRRLSRKGVQDLFEVRGTLDGLAARLAAERIDLEDYRARLKAAAQTWDRQDVRTNSVVHMQENAGFHRLILEIGGNDRLVDVVTQMQVPGFRVLFQSLLNRARLARSADDHEALAKAILDGRARRAEALARKHAHTACQMIQSLPDQEFSR